MIKHFIIISLEELEAIKMELEIVKGMKQRKKDNVLPQKDPPKPLKPFLITKDEVQKKVFGVGYPSLPVMSVEEFYEKRVQEGWFPSPCETNRRKQCDENKSATTTSATEENRETFNEMKEDDEETERLRQRDEWRDDHKRGWGNRYNRS